MSKKIKKIKYKNFLKKINESYREVGWCFDKKGDQLNSLQTNKNEK